MFDCDIRDCSAHMQRNMEKKMSARAKAKKKRKAAGDDGGVGDDGHTDEKAETPWERVSRDFNRINNMPTVQLGVDRCHLFAAKWKEYAPRMVKYLTNKCFIFKCRRAQVGPGCSSDNNSLEGTTRCQTDFLGWVRHPLVKFGPTLAHWLRHKGHDDQCRSTNSST